MSTIAAAAAARCVGAGSARRACKTTGFGRDERSLEGAGRWRWRQAARRSARRLAGWARRRLRRGRVDAIGRRARGARGGHEARAQLRRGCQRRGRRSSGRLRRVGRVADKHVIGRRWRRGHDTGGGDDNTAGGRAQDERCGPSRAARDVTERAAREYRHDSDKQVIPVAASHDGEAATNHRQRPRQQARKLRTGRQHRAPGATTEAVARSMGGRRRVTGSATGGGEELTHRTRRQPIKGRQHGSPAESGVNKKPDNRHSP